MIAYLNGFLEFSGDDRIIVEVSGIGYEVSVSSSTVSGLPEIGSDIRIFVYQHIREDEETLYGFLDKAEKALFTRLISVSGIGPKAAMKILSQTDYISVVSALRSSDIVFLASLSGIGRKTAERLVLELRDSFEDISAARMERPESENIKREAVEALIALQFPASKVRSVVNDLMAEGGYADTQGLIREALKYLGKG